MGIEECRGCKFYNFEEQTTCRDGTDEELHPDDFEAECRRYPPVRGDEEYFGKLSESLLLRDCYSGPTVQAIGWCGEWRTRGGEP